MLDIFVRFLLDGYNMCVFDQGCFCLGVHGCYSRYQVKVQIVKIKWTDTRSKSCIYDGYGTKETTNIGHLQYMTVVG
jgi:hypothetical protein